MCSNDEDPERSAETSERSAEFVAEGQLRRDTLTPCWTCATASSLAEDYEAVDCRAARGERSSCLDRRRRSSARRRFASQRPRGRSGGPQPNDTGLAKRLLEP